MINEQSKKDLTGYIKVTLWTAFTLFSLIGLTMVLAYVFNKNHWLYPLAGGLLGTFLATANLFAIGHAFYKLAIMKSRKLIIALPIFTFLAMCFAAFVLAFYCPSFLFGFALGLTVPVLFGATIVFAVSKPA